MNLINIAYYTSGIRQELVRLPFEVSRHAPKHFGLIPGHPDGDIASAANPATKPSGLMAVVVAERLAFVDGRAIADLTKIWTWTPSLFLFG
jgi:hypothetical protein